MIWVILSLFYLGFLGAVLIELVTFSQKNGMFSWSDSELIVEAVVPDFGHVLPVGDDTVLNGVFQGENSFLCLGFFSDIRLFVIHPDHDVFVLWSSDNRGERSSWGIVSRKTGLAHT
jgi:hypothetical protein